MAIESVNPATGAKTRSFEPLTKEHLDQKIGRSAAAFLDYRRTTHGERAGVLRRAADILEGEAEDLGRLATLEMGKTLGSAVAEVRKCAKACRWYADRGAEMLADEPWPVEAGRVFTRYEPLGPVLAVMPWNFPFWQVFRFAAPALCAGDTGLLKHASNVPRVALAIEDVLRRAGLPDGVFQTLLVPASAVESIVADDRVRGATLTGSESAGREVGAAASRHLKTSVLELGGSDPFLVLPSADLAGAVESAVTSRLLNNGQSCVNAKRFIVHRDVADEFTDRFVELMAAQVVGDPMRDDTDVGPLYSREAVRTLHEQVTDTVAAGARVLTGGEPLDGPGAYYPPTVLTDIPPGSPGHREEFFGPVALLWTVVDVDHAVRIANDSPFGLSASVWTTDPAEQDRLVAELATGMVYVNKFTESTPEVPFGGTKNSGYGRELATFGARSFTNPKTVWLAG